MGKAAQIQFDEIPSFLGATVGDLEDIVPGQVALAGYFCDNLDRPAPGQRYLARQLRYASRLGMAPANVIDLGDVNVFPLEPDKHFCAVQSQCTAVLKTGARLVLIGGDSSGLPALNAAARNVCGADVSVVSATANNSGNSQRQQPVILSVDLLALGGNWSSNPQRLTGLSPAQMISLIDAAPGNIIGAALFGLAPALDSRGQTETHAALAILQALAARLGKGAP